MPCNIIDQSWKEMLTIYILQAVRPEEADRANSKNFEHPTMVRAAHQDDQEPVRLLCVRVSGYIYYAM